MGVKERKERDKLEMRQTILKAAHDLFLSKGFEQISIRNIAEAIEYSPATIYLYFKDKNELFLELHNGAFAEFNKFIQDVFSIRDPFQQLTTMGKLYLEFAINNREYYELMFIMRAPMECKINTDVWPEGARALYGLEQIVKACMDAGYLKKTDPVATSFMIWSTMHGMVTLLLSDRLKLYPEEIRETLIQNAFESFVETARIK